jgi:hypothetical protein
MPKSEYKGYRELQEKDVNLHKKVKTGSMMTMRGRKQTA